MRSEGRGVLVTCLLVLTVAGKRRVRAYCRRLAGTWRRRRSIHPSSIITQEVPFNENTAAHFDRDVEKLTVRLILCSLLHVLADANGQLSCWPLLVLAV